MSNHRLDSRMSQPNISAERVSPERTDLASTRGTQLSHLSLETQNQKSMSLGADHHVLNKTADQAGIHHPHGVVPMLEA